MTGKASGRLLVPVVLLGLAETGCFSIWTVRKPAEPIDPGVPLECTRGAAAPVVDFGIAAVALGLAVPLAGDATRGFGNSAAFVYFVPALILAGFSAGSAVMGFAVTARCRELDAEIDRCAQKDRVACADLGQAVPGKPIVPKPPVQAPAAPRDERMGVEIEPR